MRQQRKRIFIAINLPEKAKKRLLTIQKEWTGLPIRWTKPENLHITLVFLGYLDDEEMYQICQLSKQAVKQKECFEVELNRVCLALDEQSPRMLWVKGKVNPELGELKKSLETTFLNSNQSDFTNPEKKAFSPHVTLGRINQREWQKMPRQPIIDQEIRASFMVDSIEVMESVLKHSGPEYIVLESIDLK